MNKNLGASMRVHARVDDCLNKNKDLVEKYSRLKLERGVFDTKRTWLAEQVAKKGEITTGITLDKAETFSNYADLLISACQKARVWAKDINNQALVAVFTIKPSSFARKTYDQKLETGKTIYAALSNNAAALANEKLSAADIAAIADATKLCEAANIAPSVASADKKTANDNADRALADVNSSIATMGELIASEYRVTEPDFVSSYQNSRKLETVAVRHTGIRATITDAATGKAIENATLIIGGTKKTAVSNMAGLAEISRMKAGSYHISIAAQGYVTQLQDITVGKGKVVELAVALVAS